MKADERYLILFSTERKLEIIIKAEVPVGGWFSRQHLRETTKLCFLGELFLLIWKVLFVLSLMDAKKGEKCDPLSY